VISHAGVRLRSGKPRRPQPLTPRALPVSVVGAALRALPIALLRPPMRCLPRRPRAYPPAVDVAAVAPLAHHQPGPAPRAYPTPTTRPRLQARLQDGGRDSGRAVCEDPLGQARRVNTAARPNRGLGAANSGPSPTYGRSLPPRWRRRAHAARATRRWHRGRGDPDGDWIQMELGRGKREPDPPTASEQPPHCASCAAAESPLSFGFW
jgi:hypothetical protein